LLATLVVLAGLIGSASHAAAVSQPVLRLPFAAGASWRANGPHGDGTNGAGTAYSVDMAPNDGKDGTVLAAAAGTARKSNTCSIDVDLGGGWSIRYQHLGTFLGSYPRTVSVGDPLGITKANDSRGITCNPNSLSHLHFGLLYQGAPYPIRDVTIGGYTVHSGSGPYLGSWTRNSDGKTVITVPSNGNVTCCLVNNQTAGVLGDQASATRLRGDYNGDGTSDVAILHKGSSATNVWVLWGSKTGTTPLSTSQLVNQLPTSQGWIWDNMKIGAGDYNGDGTSDVAILHKGSSATNVWVLWGSKTGTTPLSTSQLVNQLPTSQGWIWDNMKIG
jgi:hypothetical protein